MEPNKQTQEKINLLLGNPTLTNTEIVERFNMDCHPNNLTNIRKRYNLPSSPHKKGTKTTGKKKCHQKTIIESLGKELENLIEPSKNKTFGLANIKNLTKYRFISEFLGYSGTSLTVGGYKKWIRTHV